MTMPTIKFHPTMPMALMDRWDENTSTFLLLVGEMTVTLEDVYHILCLPIRGETVRYQADHFTTKYKMEQVYCIGRVMHSETRGHIMVIWLLHPTDEVPLVRQLMVATIALAMLPNGHDTHMHGNLTYAIRDMERHKRLYSWGQSMLSNLYHDLGEYMFGQGCSMMTCTLLQVQIFKHIMCTRPTRVPLDLVLKQPRVFSYPLTHEWQFGDLLYWILIIDRLTVDAIRWRPYLNMYMWVGIPRQLFCMQRNHQLEGWYSHIAIPFYFDQIWLQFEFEQCVPIDVPIYI